MGVLFIVAAIIFTVWLCTSSSSRPISGNRYKNKAKNTYGYHRTSYATNLVSSYKNSQLRENFDQMKTTDFFKKWKKAQYNCQHGQCAWCKCRLDLHSPNTQVDHIKPLCKGGDNDYNNLVLACKSCNYYCKKGNYVWRDRNNTVHNGWNKPTWIEDNPLIGKETLKDTQPNEITLR